MTTVQERKVIVFNLNGEEYAVPVQSVGSIERMMQITRVPKAEHFIKGVINLKGVVTPIVDLRLRFGTEKREYDDSTRIIIVYYRDMEIGLVVDGANDVIDISVNDIEPPPEVINTVHADYIEGVVKLGNRLLVLLDLEKVLDKKEFDFMKMDA
ncbi:chemotaxis protein CheW [Aciduricibacillus chroicocephali]|uniref:Chemotaxis protein CheW n=1 Tax=Aciduricibacillus chroicocephali TaxID=3054939 RepID=A0ABY9KYI0_9BACI|nr:chemotaxis protein CheW [Bacillaceae bacterium 44XB]